MDDQKTQMLMDAFVTVCGIVCAYLLGEIIGRAMERRRGRTLAQEAEEFLIERTKGA